MRKREFSLHIKGDTGDTASIKPHILSMSALKLSNIGLLLSCVPILIHGTEWLFPNHARLVASYVCPLFGLNNPLAVPALADSDIDIMLTAAKEAAPSEKWTAAADYLFVLAFEQRQGSVGFLAGAITYVYGMYLPLSQRFPIHFIAGIVALLMTVVNANQAGIPFLGFHPAMTFHGKMVGVVFTPFWIAVCTLNYTSFYASQAAASKME